jgi:hypothetical protein
MQLCGNNIQKFFPGGSDEFDLQKPTSPKMLLQTQTPVSQELFSILAPDNTHLAPDFNTQLWAGFQMIFGSKNGSCHSAPSWCPDLQTCPGDLFLLQLCTLIQ